MASKIFLGQHEFGPKKILSKKTGGLTQGGGYMTPPWVNPPEKILLGVHSCPKRFFVKKKNIGRVNPGGGGGLMTPPRK